MDGIKGVLNEEHASHIISPFQITILLGRNDVFQSRASLPRTFIIITTTTTSSDNERDNPLKLLKK